MARMTPNRDAVVVRLVYDGPPRSGKTTSLNALAEGMGRTVYSPEEAEGRTLFFDWMEFVGGSFEGIPIRCEVLSVPGQEALAARRLALLAGADAVVFVLNGAPEQMAMAASHLRGLKQVLDAQTPPRAGIIVQANHRDRPDALAISTLQDDLDLEGIAIIESVATANQGIREAFVLSVRLALDRVREMAKLGTLPIGPAEQDVPSRLLASLQALEGESLQGPPLRPEEPPPSAMPAGPETAGAQPAPEAASETAPEAVPETALDRAAEPVRQADPASASGPPRLPDSTIPIGRVWPPIDGRIVLHSASTPGAEPRLAKDGSWRFQAGGWHFHSMPQHEFESLDDAKQELLVWAQQQVAGVARLSPQRCIALAETGWGTSRLWQIVRGRQSLHQRLRVALPGASVADAEEILGSCIALFLEARESFRSEPPLPCQLDVIGVMGGRPVYCGLLPLPGWTPSTESLALSEEDLILREMQPMIDAAGGDLPWRDGLTAALAGLIARRPWTLEDRPPAS